MVARGYGGVANLHWLPGMLLSWRGCCAGGMPFAPAALLDSAWTPLLAGGVAERLDAPAPVVLLDGAGMAPPDLKLRPVSA